MCCYRHVAETAATPSTNQASQPGKLASAAATARASNPKRMPLTHNRPQLGLQHCACTPPSCMHVGLQQLSLPAATNDRSASRNQRISQTLLLTVYAMYEHHDGCVRCCPCGFVRAAPPVQSQCAMVTGHHQLPGVTATCCQGAQHCITERQAQQVRMSRWCCCLEVEDSGDTA